MDFGPGWLHFILSYEARFYKPIILKFRSTLCRITAHATVPGYLFHNFSFSCFWSKFVVHYKWPLQGGWDSNLWPLGLEFCTLLLDHGTLTIYSAIGFLEMTLFIFPITFIYEKMIRQHITEIETVKKAYFFILFFKLPFPLCLRQLQKNHWYVDIY